MSRLPHVYLPSPWAGDTIEAGPDTVHHLTKVLRLTDGARLSYTDGVGTVGEGVLAGGSVERGAEVTEPPPTPKITVAVAAPKATERARFIVEKLAELGAGAVVWLETERGEGRPPPAAKAMSWATSALQQSRGLWLMAVSGPAQPAALESPIWAASLDGGAMPDVPESVTLMIGPEGGLSRLELEAAQAAISLGKATLRTETAAVVFATLVLGAGGRIGPGG